MAAGVVCQSQRVPLVDLFFAGHDQADGQAAFIHSSLLTQSLPQTFQRVRNHFTAIHNILVQFRALIASTVQEQWVVGSVIVSPFPPPQACGYRKAA